MFHFTIRDVLWWTIAVAVAFGGALIVIEGKREDAILPAVCVLALGVLVGWLFTFYDRRRHK